MSLQYNDETTLNGLVQNYEEECGYNLGDVSGSTVLLKKFNAKVRQAIDAFFVIALKAAGKWQVDDTNHGDLAIIYTDLTIGVRDYTILRDEDDNLVLDIYRVFVKDSASGPYRLLEPADQQSDNATEPFYDGLDARGPAGKYDKMGNSISLDYIPSATITDGLMLMINREALYPDYDETDFIVGVPGIFHDYFWMKPALQYARIHAAKNYLRLEAAILNMEREIEDYFGSRARDERPTLGSSVADIPFK